MIHHGPAHLDNERPCIIQNLLDGSLRAEFATVHEYLEGFERSSISASSRGCWSWRLDLEMALWKILGFECTLAASLSIMPPRVPFPVSPRESEPVHTLRLISTSLHARSFIALS